MVLVGINRTAWDTKLFLTAVQASPVDCIGLCHILKAQHCFLSLNGCLYLLSAPHPLHLPPYPFPGCPSPINSIRYVTETEKNYLKNQQHLTL